MAVSEIETLRTSFDEAEAFLARAPSSLVCAFAEGVARAPCRRLLDDTSETIALGRPLTLFGAPIDDLEISRRHAELTFVAGARDTEEAGGRWVLRDLGSKNGSFVDGVRINGMHTLSPGDLIRLGNTLFFFSDATTPAEADPILVGESNAIGRVRESLAAVAPHPRSVLLTGETGTGKEVVAREIHRRSGRAGRFVAFNCGGFVSGTLSSELFGHVRGAFTGAVSERLGLFREAHGGTLFLDEIGEMNAEAQVQLLRVLETGQVRAVGATREHAVDVRVVAATNRDLIASTRSGAFRSDLYGRLAQWPIVLPPLRGRREDIPLLIRNLLPRVRGEGRLLLPELAETLCLHRWSLNVRGLLNVLSIAVLRSPTGPLGLGSEVASALAADAAIAELDRAAPTPTAMPITRGTTPPATPSATAGYPVISASPEKPGPTSPVVAPSRDELVALLTTVKGNVLVAARQLGASRQQLYRWLKTYDLSPDAYRVP